MGNVQASEKKSRDELSERLKLFKCIKSFINEDKTSYNYIADLRKDNINTFIQKNSIGEKSQMSKHLSSKSLEELNLELFIRLISTGVGHEVNSTLYKAVTIPKLSDANTCSTNAFDLELIGNQAALLIDWIHRTYYNDKEDQYKDWSPLQEKVVNCLDNLEEDYSSIEKDEDEEYSNILDKNELSIEKDSMKFKYNKKSSKPNAYSKKKPTSSERKNTNLNIPKITLSNNALLSQNVGNGNNQITNQKKAPTKLKSNKNLKSVNIQKNKKAQIPDFDQKTVNSLLNVMNKSPNNKGNIHNKEEKENILIENLEKENTNEENKLLINPFNEIEIIREKSASKDLKEIIQLSNRKHESKEIVEEVKNTQIENKFNYGNTATFNNNQIEFQVKKTSELVETNDKNKEENKIYHKVKFNQNKIKNKNLKTDPTTIKKVNQVTGTKVKTQKTKNNRINTYSASASNNLINTQSLNLKTKLTNKDTLEEKDKQFANLILQSISPLKSPINLKNEYSPENLFFQTIEDEDIYLKQILARKSINGKINKKARTKEKVKNSNTSARTKSKIKKRIRIDIRNLIQDLENEKYDSSKSSNNANEHTNNKEYTPLLTHKKSIYRNDNISTKNFPIYEKKTNSKITPTFNKPIISSQEFFKSKKLVEDESANGLENNNNYNTINNNLNAFSTNSAYSLMAVDRKIGRSSVKGMKKVNSTMNTRVGIENKHTFNPQLEFNEVIANIELPKFDLDLSPLKQVKLPYDEVLKQLKENNKFLFEVTNEEKMINNKIKSFKNDIEINNN